MQRSFLLKLSSSLLLAALAWSLCTLQAQSPPETPPKTEPDPQSKPVRKPKTLARIPLQQAREQAALLDKVYASTLDVVHHHFFRNDRAILPARAVEDIFADLERETDIQSRWIAVNTKAMSVNHEPESDFEELAARELSAGKPAVEIVEDGYFRRVTPVPLGARCVGCHTGVFSPQATAPRLAGLVISIPITEESLPTPVSPKE